MSEPFHSHQVTQRDVAKALGISHSSVSLALRNSPKITLARREEIRKKAEEMGYRPNSAATALAHYKQSSLVSPVRAALAWFNFWNPPERLHSYSEFAHYWKGATVAAEKLGYHIEEFAAESRLSIPRLEQILQTRGISGILLPPHMVTPDWGSFGWERFSIVRYGRSLQAPKVHMVAADHVANTILAFNEIRARGYNRVAFLTGTSRNRGHLFEAGFLMAQRFVEESLRIPIFSINDSEPLSCLPELRRWLKREKPDAILSDVVETPELLQKAGYRIAEDIGIAATSVLDATVDAGIFQNPEEIGRIGVLLAASLISDNDTGIPKFPRQTLVEGQWMDGASLPRRA